MTALEKAGVWPHIGAMAPKRPRDPNQLAKAIVDIASGAVSDAQPDPSPVTEFARKGGLKGGTARARSLSPEKRREIARAAAASRWGKKPR